MSVAKKKLTLSVDADTYKSLSALSVKHKQDLSNFSVSLLQKALSLEEDMYFSLAANKRMAHKQKLIDHDTAWKDHTK